MTTNLQPTFARQVFPCWDEPEFKATFDVSIKHYPNYTVYSNMPVKKKGQNDEIGKIWTNFQTTPLMSVHHLAIAISDFLNVEKRGNLSFWSDNSTEKSLLNESLEIGSKTLMILEKYTKVPFMLPKIDIVGFPSLDKIENWGLIYFW